MFTDAAAAFRSLQLGGAARPVEELSSSSSSDDDEPEAVPGVLAEPGTSALLQARLLPSGPR